MSSMDDEIIQEAKKLCLEIMLWDTHGRDPDQTARIVKRATTLADIINEKHMNALAAQSVAKIQAALAES
jgi:hypothetical protein